MQLWLDTLQQHIEKLKADGQYRTLKKYNKVDFISNDYLGIAMQDALQEHMIEPLMNYYSNRLNLGSTGSRLLKGNSAIHENVEEYFKKYFDCADTLIANSGYDANLAILSALPSRNDVVLYDEKVHASIKDGMRLSLASRYSVKHNDWNDLEQKIKRHRALKPNAVLFYVFETVYSMDGDIPEVKDLIELCEKYEVILIADEAHAFGVFGKEGKGILQDQKLHKKVAIRMFGFGKAAATYGAIIAVQDKVIKSYLLNTARSIIYTTALSSFQVEVMRLSAGILEYDVDSREALYQNIKLFQSLLPQLTVKTPIIPFIIENKDELLRRFEEIQNAGFDVGMIRYPTVPKGKERLRIIVHSFNEEEDIRALADILNKS